MNRRNNRKAKVAKLRETNELVGPIDHELPVLTVTGNDGQLKAIAGGYACHATVLSDYFVSADWPGAGQNESERRHPGAIACFCRLRRRPKSVAAADIASVKKYGAEFADGVDAALKSAKPMSPKLHTAYEEIDLPFDKLPTRAELEQTTAKGEKPQAPWANFF